MMEKLKSVKLDKFANSRKNFQGYWGSACKAFSNGTQGIASVLKKSTSAHSNLFSEFDNRRKKSTNCIHNEKVDEEISSVHSKEAQTPVSDKSEDLKYNLVETNANKSSPEEFPEETEIKPEALLSLRSLIETKGCYENMRQDDSFLLRFLRARKFDSQAAFILYSRYFEYRRTNKLLFQNFSSKESDINQALMDGLPGVLPIPDDFGHRILLIYTANWDHSRYGLLAVYRALLLTLEHLIEDEHVQVNGFVLIIDWSGFAFRHSSVLQPRLLRTVIEGLQDCFPGRFYGVHFVNQPWYIEAALTVVKSFLKEKTKDRIFLHGNNLTTLHSHISKEVLPAELGGYCAPYNTRIWAEKIMRDESLIFSQEWKDSQNDLKNSSKINRCAVHSETFPMNLNKPQCVNLSTISDLDEEYLIS